MYLREFFSLFPFFNNNKSTRYNVILWKIYIISAFTLRLRIFLNIFEIAKGNKTYVHIKTLTNYEYLQLRLWINTYILRLWIYTVILVFSKSCSMKIELRGSGMLTFTIMRIHLAGPTIDESASYINILVSRKCPCYKISFLYFFVPFKIKRDWWIDGKWYPEIINDRWIGFCSPNRDKSIPMEQSGDTFNTTSYLLLDNQTP